MSSYDKPQGRGSILQLNSELQRAQLELLSAHCATHQLRLHYTADELIRFGRRDILRKSAEAASALSQYYSDIQNKMPKVELHSVPSPQPTGEQIAQAVQWLASYLQAQRDHYYPAAGPLSPEMKEVLSCCFSGALLNRIRVLELRGARVAVPDFFAQARALGFDSLPEISHMDSLTFLDVIVFNERLSERSLFHALVHTIQIEVLGLERYAELWVSSFIKTRAHFTVPLEVHAFSLASKFVRSDSCSVEDQVMQWVAEDRYTLKADPK
jgi:hypothetical protein